MTMQYRWNVFKGIRQAIEDNEGGLDKFSQGVASCHSVLNLRSRCHSQLQRHLPMKDGHERPLRLTAMLTMATMRHRITSI